MAARSHHAPCRPPAPGPRLARRPPPADAGGRAVWLREGRRHSPAGLQDGRPCGPAPPGGGGAAPPGAARRAAAPEACREGAAGAPRQARGRQGAAEAAGGRPPLAELVRRHGLPEVDPDLRLDEGITTMVIVNVPYAYPRQMLQADINEWGFPYNYFHCPQDSRQGRSRGLAFINFLTPLAAAAFKRCFDKRELSCPGAEAQVVTVLPSRLQGLEKNAQLHPEGRVLDPHWQLHQHRQRTRQLRQQQQAPAGGFDSSRGACPAAPAGAGPGAAACSSRAALGPTRRPPPWPPGAAPQLCRLSL